MVNFPRLRYKTTTPARSGYGNECGVLKAGNRIIASDVNRVYAEVIVRRFNLFVGAKAKTKLFKD
jgi:hypothetical protein